MMEYNNNQEFSTIMANDSHSKVWAFMVAAFRLILVVMCILSLFCAVYVIPSLATHNLISNMYTISIYTLPAGGINLFIAASVGIYGVYAGNPKCLKWFALLISIYAVFCLLDTTIFIATTDRDNEMVKFSAMMQDYAKNYQFHLTADGEPNEATKSWDLLQGGLTCCGIDGSADWELWRSNTSSVSHRLPQSCCVKVPRSLPEMCTTSSPYVHEYGCRDTIEAISSFYVFPDFLIEPLIGFVLAAMALAVAKDIVGRCPNIPQQSYDKFYILS